MALEIPANLARKLIGDPVMAAEVIMGAKLDTFQATRLRMQWFTPWFMDHSGVSTGKTDVNSFIFAFLRVILLPNPPDMDPRIVSVYYQSMGLAAETFIPKIDKYANKSELFLKQIKLQHGRKLFREMKGCWLIEGRAGWRVELPAGDFMKDSQNQASKRFNDLVIDECPMIDGSGSKGINKQLLQRNTLECFNPNHPVWCNHTAFLGHAEDPAHPYYKRYVKLRKAVRSGSQVHGYMTSSYRDYRGEFYKRYGQDIARKAEDQRKGDLDEAEAAQVLDGLWKRGAKGWYGTTLRDSIERLDLRPQFRRRDAGTIYTLGNDFADGIGGNTDMVSGTVTAATPVPKELLTPEFSRLGIKEVHGIPWLVRPVFGYSIQPEDSGILAALIHRLHLLFNFSRIVLDGRGGGASVYRELVKDTQVIDGKPVRVRGLCAAEHQAQYQEAESIVCFFSRGDSVMRAHMGEHYMKDSSGMNEFAHAALRMAMRRGEYAWPARAETREKAGLGLAGLMAEECEVLAQLEGILGQFANIAVKVGPDQMPLKSEAGFKRFTKSGGKTDGAMGALYSHVGMMSLLDAMPEVKEPDATPMGVF